MTDTSGRESEKEWKENDESIVPAENDELLPGATSDDSVFAGGTVISGRTIQFPSNPPRGLSAKSTGEGENGWEEKDATNDSAAASPGREVSAAPKESFLSFFDQNPNDSGQEDRKFRKNFRSFFENAGEESDDEEESPEEETEPSIDEFAGRQYSEEIAENLDAMIRQNDADTLFVLGEKYPDGRQAGDGDNDDGEAIFDSEDGVELSPTTILEAMFFVGDRQNVPLPLAKATELMRNVSESEAREAIDALNVRYVKRGAPYQIIEDADGFRMILRPELESVRERFFGRVKEVRLSQKAIDVLAVVAYRQPISLTEIQEVQPGAATIIAQLTKRDLVTQEKRAVNQKEVAYYRTTPRFLKLLGIDSLDDLPIVDEIDYR